jgi:hypothetical protein
MTLKMKTILKTTLYPYDLFLSPLRQKTLYSVHLSRDGLTYCPGAVTVALVFVKAEAARAMPPASIASILSVIEPAFQSHADKVKGKLAVNAADVTSASVFNAL